MNKYKHLGGFKAPRGDVDAVAVRSICNWGKFLDWLLTTWTEQETSAPSCCFLLYGFV